MAGIGTIINVLGVVLGSIAGIFVKKGISEKLRKNLIRVQGLGVVILGLSGVLSKLGSGKNDELVLLLSLVIGTFIGEVLGLEEGIEGFGERLKKKFGKGEEGFAQGFLLSSLTMCIGAMGIIGALNDALYGDISLLLSKTVLDTFTAFMLAGFYGIGVLFSVLPLAIWQGGFTLLAGALAPYLTELVLHNLSLVGSALILGIGINLLFDSELPLANMLPSLILAVLFAAFL
ncbi:MAG: DUF554 domain-containing protein [Tissierellia bacterium]|nr:DUF554 domain-containing protein [Tissierellia bacterium]